MTDSLFGENRVSRIAVAPDDDWSPENLRVPASGFANLTLDSILIAIQAAGFRGVIADGQDPDARATKRGHGPSATNPRGYLWEQDNIKVRGEDFKVLTHTGYGIMGGRAQVSGGTDSVNAGGGEGTGIFYKELSRLYAGALLDFDQNNDTWQYDGLFFSRAYDDIHARKVERVLAGSDYMRPVVKGNVFRLCAADLSGVPYGGPGGAPAANGYWILKSAANAFAVINKLAGRTVIKFGYPEDIEP